MKNIAFGLLLVLLLPACGKNQSTGGAVGAVTGAAIGTAVSRGKGEGALIGALAGGLLGSSMGASADIDEAEEREAELEYKLRKATEKWCASCGRKVSVKGAQTCPACGDELITQKICSRCATEFEPSTGYKFCPYCRGREPLVSR